MSKERSVITIATTKPVFLVMAMNLARSFRYWNSTGDIGFTIATDLADPLPIDLDWVDVRRFAPGALGKGFSSKLRLDELAHARQTLFIDSDCLVFKPLDFIFDELEGMPVTAYGSAITDGHVQGDVAAILNRFGLNEMPVFNSGIYYIEPGETARAVFAKARELEESYDEIGFTRLRGRPNDEVIVALAMALHGLPAYSYDSGSIMAHFFSHPYPVRMDVFSGDPCLSNRGGDFGNRTGPRKRDVSPAIVHFLCDQVDRWPYRRNALALNLLYRKGYPIWLARAAGRLVAEAPERFIGGLKYTLRPVYHRLFGARPIEKSWR